MRFRSLVLSALLAVPVAAPIALHQPLAVAAPAAGEYEKLVQGAKAGDPKAQDALGQYLFEGLGGVPDYQEAYKWTEKAAAKGVPASQVRLGILLSTSLGLAEANEEEAFKWFMKAARQDDPDGLAMVGLAYRGGDGCTSSDKEAFKWLKKAALKGHARAMHHLGVLYVHGWGVEENAKEGRAWLGKAGKAGHMEAYNELADSYAYDDEAKAMGYLRLAAEGGNVMAMVNAGRKLLSADKPEPLQEGVKWLRQAAERGNADAQLMLGKLLAGECPHDSYSLHEDRVCLEGLPKDQVEGNRLLFQSLDRGDDKAFLAVAHLFTEGRGVKKDLGIALHYLQLAAGGDEYTSTALQELLDGIENGTYKLEKPEDAAKWYLKSADAGEVRGALGAATAYESGKGLPKNLVESAYWFTRVVALGDDPDFKAEVAKAQAGLKRVSPQLSAPQRQELRHKLLAVTILYY